MRGLEECQAKYPGTGSFDGFKGRAPARCYRCNREVCKCPKSPSVAEFMRQNPMIFISDVQVNGEIPSESAMDDLKRMLSKHTAGLSRGRLLTSRDT